MNNRTLALLAALAATTIYGLNHTVAKVVMPHHIGAFGFIMLRVVGASLLFWAVSPFFPKERIAKKDFKRLFFAALFGMCINMLMFFKGLELSTPINSGVIVTLTPIIILILSAIFLKERLTTLKVMGIVLGFIGALALVFNNAPSLVPNAPNIPLGNIMLLINASCFGAYLVIIKPLTQKYHTVTLMKWIFPIGIILTFPITVEEFLEVDWSNLPFDALWRMAYVVIGTTFFAYLLNVFALKTLNATTIGAFTYLQPILAILYALATGNDQLDWVKVVACLMVFLGVYLVSKKRKTATMV
ncbi:MAG: DMT family transporter [Flavobacteriaceae bacterium]